MRTGSDTLSRLLMPDEPPPVLLERPDGASFVLLIADHAGNRVPRSLQGLGLSDADRRRHIAYDIGILGVSLVVSKLLDATLIHQPYSRLVIDCNRHPQYHDAFLDWSDGTPVPGNRGLSVTAAAQRIVEIFMPYHNAIATWLDRRAVAGRPTAIVAMHSFTPYHSALPEPRPWGISVLFNRDRAIADRLIPSLRAHTHHLVGVNQPYVADELTDFGILEHGERRGVPSVELEIRQDLITTEADQQYWGEMLAPLIHNATHAVLSAEPSHRALVASRGI
jgi:predicted N-formylglutamate amidohydrolase